MLIKTSIVAVATIIALGTFTYEAAAQQELRAPRRLVTTELKLPVPDAALQSQFDQLRSMPAVQVEYSPLGSVKRLQGRTGVIITPAGRGVKYGQAADEIFARIRGVLLAKGTEKLIVRHTMQFPNEGKMIVRMEQTIRGIPVEGSDAQLEIDTQTGEILLASFFFVPDQGLPSKPKLSAAEAFVRAAQSLEESDKAEKGSVQRGAAPQLKYYRPHRKSELPRLVWAVGASYVPKNSTNAIEEVVVLIDAIEGEIVELLPSVARAVNWPAYTAFNALPATQNFPDQLGNTTDAVASAAWNNLARADVAWADYGLGPTPKQIETVVHYGTNYFNAVTERRLSRDWIAFGDGAGSSHPYYSGPLGNSQDIAAHEYGHSRIADIKPFNRALRETMAVEEFFADFSAVMADNRWRGTPSSGPTFEIGEIYHRRPGIGARSWNVPFVGVFGLGLDWYPSYRETMGAHGASTVLGLAYRLMVTGGLHPRAGLAGIPPIDVTPRLDDATAKAVFIRGLQSPSLSVDTTIFQMRQAIEGAADTVSPFARTTVSRAFDAVGIGYACAAPPPRPTLDVYDLMCGGKFYISWFGSQGARHYAEAVRAGYPWSLATPVIDGPELDCMVTVRTTSYVRLKACNACGCSEYTEPVTMNYWPGACP